jgi:sulfate adenylyltransferase (ADP) / ATP adenylyltransferase
MPMPEPLREGGLLLAPGTLGPAVRRRTAAARRAGALVPIATRLHVVVDGGVRFAVREAAGLARKARATAAQERSGADPFLPYDEALFVADLSATHLCLLNRFNAVDHHLLVVTRRFAEQQDLLDRADFTALWACLGELDGLAFYNSGPEAGASQRHKHLQLVPLPLGEGPERTPLDPLLAAARFDGEVGRVEELPFAHALARLGQAAAAEPAAAATASLDLYRRLLAAVGEAAASGSGARPGPYNLLVTREWMLLVPRSRAAAESIEVNALGYAGSLLVRDGEQLRRLERLGPMTLLRRVGREWP